MSRGNYKYGVGIFGIGDVAQEHIKGYIRNPLTEIKALASRKKESARAARAKFNLDCEILDSYDQLLERDDINIISMCSPNFLRVDEIKKAIDARKHFFAEKPIAHTLEDLKSIKNYYEKAKYDVKTVVGFVIEYYDQFLCIKSLIEKGGIGKVYFVETDYWYELGPEWTAWTWDPGPYTKKGGGAASLISGCHAIGAMMSIGGDVEEVFCYETRGHRQDFEYAPTYASVVKFRNGAIGRTGASLEVTSPFFFNIMIHGTKGSILNDKFYTKEFFTGQEGYQTFNCSSIDIGEAYQQAFSAAIDAFIKDIDQDIDSRIRLDFGLKVHEVAFALIKSAEIGRPVKLPLL
ncbi:MAG: Gfo/Idh/MocA family oxidoreductase [Spirochaetota bacterium]|nr:MAG: Gfo/Idh/MocA family oxidoreductase [Spirochaetota bacterium]